MKHGILTQGSRACQRKPPNPCSLVKKLDLRSDCATFFKIVPPEEARTFRRTPCRLASVSWFCFVSCRCQLMAMSTDIRTPSTWSTDTPTTKNPVRQRRGLAAPDLVCRPPWSNQIRRLNKRFCSVLQPSNKPCIRKFKTCIAKLSGCAPNSCSPNQLKLSAASATSSGCSVYMPGFGPARMFHVSTYRCSYRAPRASGFSCTLLTA